MTTESEALDRLAAIIDDQYPKGTTSIVGKELRHELHKAGRLNEPKKRAAYEVLRTQGEAILAIADTMVYDHAGGLGFNVADGKRRMAEGIYDVLQSKTPSGLFQVLEEQQGYKAFWDSVNPNYGS